MYISINDSISNHENTFEDYPRTPPPRDISPRIHNNISYPHVFNRGANMNSGIANVPFS